MLTLIKEDGTGRPDANTYASLADAESYHEGRTHADLWAAATSADQQKALVTATRIIDACCRFNGWKATDTQALQWPRIGAADPDRARDGLLSFPHLQEPSWPPNQVPPPLVDAVCEQARAMLASADRAADPAGEGLSQVSLSGSLSIQFNPADRTPMLAPLARRLLARLGTIVPPNPSTVNLQRA